MKPSTDSAAGALPFSQQTHGAALAALFVLTLRQHVRGRRLLVVSLLFALPAALAAVVNLASRVPPHAESLQFSLIFELIPHALVPLAALLYATGMIQDEVEEQTLTYLLLRPLPRWAIYIVKLLATLLLTSLVTALFTAAAFAVIVFTAKDSTPAELVETILKTVGLLTLTQVAYCALFGLLGLLMRRSLLVGVSYIVLFEGVLATLDTVARRLTVMYYFRVLVLRWLAPASGSDWKIDLTTAPTAQTCVLTLVGVGVVLAIAAALLFASKEFRMKTPEGT
jgi:ABC-2 type transport system permease protein